MLLVRASLLLIFLIIAGCATVESPQSEELDQRLAQAVQADQIARLMVGRYIGLRQSDSSSGLSSQGSSQSPGLVRLHVEIDPASSSVQAVVRMQQIETDANMPREFIVAFRPDDASAESILPNQLRGDFAPLNANGQPIRSCSLDVVVQADGFVAQTRAADCRFASGSGEVALIKEIAHDGQRLVIGDRLQAVNSAEPVAPDQIIQFDRIQNYIGWAGARETEAADWRLAREFQLESSGGRLIPQDAGGMDLNIAIELAPYRWRADEPSVLRLRAFDLETGQLLGQSWANTNASQIGLALPNVQIGLMLQLK